MQATDSKFLYQLVPVIAIDFPRGAEGGRCPVPERTEQSADLPAAAKCLNQ